MGIIGLNPFLKKYAPNAFSTVSLSVFAKKRIAIDISLYLYKFKVVFGQHWMSGVINLLTTLREHSIHPVVIFDGEPPIEKLIEQQNRRLARDERNKKYLSLMNKVDVFNNTGVISDDLQDFYQKSIINYTPMLLANQITDTFDVNVVVEKLTKMKNQNVRVTYQDIQSVQNLLQTMCIQNLQAPTEAEALCSWLNIKGVVDGVLTEDTDVLAYGSPLFLNKINTSTNTCTMINYDKILDELQLTREQFTEFCIMCGCDYNQRIKGVGPARIYKMYKKYTTYNNIMENEPKYDYTVLQMDRIKTIFTEYNLGEIINEINLDEWYSGAPKFTEIEAFLKQYNSYIKPDRIYNACLQDAYTTTSINNNKFIKKRSSPSFK